MKKPKEVKIGQIWTWDGSHYRDDTYTSIKITGRHTKSYTEGWDFIRRDGKTGWFTDADFKRDDMTFVSDEQMIKRAPKIGQTWEFTAGSGESYLFKIISRRLDNGFRYGPGWDIEYINNYPYGKFGWFRNEDFEKENTKFIRDPDEDFSCLCNERYNNLKKEHEALKIKYNQLIHELKLKIAKYECK